MTASNDQILEFVYMSPVLIKRINKLVPKDLVEDMRIHLILLLSNMNHRKLHDLYTTDSVIKYTMRILHTQMSPRCNNCFHQIYFGPKQIPDLYKSTPFGSVSLETNGYTEGNSKDYEIFMYELDGIKIPGIHSKVLNEVMNYLKVIEPHKYVIFYQSYIEGYSNKEISIMCNVHIQTIINWKTQLLKEIKKYLRERNYAIPDNNNN